MKKILMKKVLMKKILMKKIKCRENSSRMHLVFMLFEVSSDSSLYIAKKVIIFKETNAILSDFNLF